MQGSKVIKPIPDGEQQFQFYITYPSGSSERRHVFAAESASDQERWTAALDQHIINIGESLSRLVMKGRGIKILSHLFCRKFVKLGAISYTV